MPDNQNTSMTVRDRHELAVGESVGEYSELAEFVKQIGALREKAIVLCPAVSAMPPGWGVVLSAVNITPDDTYDIEGKVALGKSGIDKIAAAAGVSWDPKQSGRVDDGADPNYCEYRAVGTITDMDGQKRTIMGTRDTDLRAGSAKYEEIMEATAQGKPAPDWKKQKNLRRARLFILPMTESKAMLRAVRSALGIAVSYPADEIRTKPFLVAKPYFHGKTGDPEVDREIAKMQAAHALGIVDQVYGQRALPEPETTPPPKPVAPPALPAPEEGAQAPEGDGVDRDVLLDRFESTADAKGKLGDGKGQATRATASRWATPKILEAIGRLEELPNVAPKDQPPNADAGDDPIPWD